MKFMCRIGNHDWDMFSDVMAELVLSKEGYRFERRFQRRVCFYCGCADERVVSMERK